MDEIRFGFKGEEKTFENITKHSLGLIGSEDDPQDILEHALGKKVDPNSVDGKRRIEQITTAMNNVLKLVDVGDLLIPGALNNVLGFEFKSYEATKVTLEILKRMEAHPEAAIPVLEGDLLLRSQEDITFGNVVNNEVQVKNTYDSKPIIHQESIQLEDKLFDDLLSPGEANGMIDDFLGRSTQYLVGVDQFILSNDLKIAMNNLSEKEGSQITSEGISQVLDLDLKKYSENKELRSSIEGFFNERLKGRIAYRAQHGQSNNSSLNTHLNALGELFYEMVDVMPSFTQVKKSLINEPVDGLKSFYKNHKKRVNLGLTYASGALVIFLASLYAKDNVDWERLKGDLGDVAYTAIDSTSRTYSSLENAISDMFESEEEIIIEETKEEMPVINLEEPEEVYATKKIDTEPTYEPVLQIEKEPTETIVAEVLENEPKIKEEEIIIKIPLSSKENLYCPEENNSPINIVDKSRLNLELLCVSEDLCLISSNYAGKTSYLPFMSKEEVYDHANSVLEKNVPLSKDFWSKVSIYSKSN